MSNFYLEKKICKECKEEKNYYEYNFSKVTNLPSSKCKECTNKNSKRYKIKCNGTPMKDLVSISTGYSARFRGPSRVTGNLVK